MLENMLGTWVFSVNVGVGCGVGEFIFIISSPFSFLMPKGKHHFFFSFFFSITPNGSIIFNFFFPFSLHVSLPPPPKISII